VSRSIPNKQKEQVEIDYYLPFTEIEEVLPLTDREVRPATGPDASRSPPSWRPDLVRPKDLVSLFSSPPKPSSSLPKLKAKSQGKTHFNSLIHRSRRQHIHSSLPTPFCSIRRTSIDLSSSSRNDRPSPSHTRHEMPVRFDRFRASTRREIPNSNGFVVRGGEEMFPVGMEDESSDPVVVAGLGTRSR